MTAGRTAPALLRERADADRNRRRGHRQRDGRGGALRAQPSTFLGIFEATKLVPVPIAPILRLDLAAQPAALGSARWIIVNADATQGVPIT